MMTPTVERKINLITKLEEPKNCWITPFFKYLTEGRLVSDKALAKKVKLKLSQYVVQSGKLYRRSYLQPLLRCVGPVQTNYTIKDFHERDCGSYVGGARAR